jgi:hypothetical protein
LAFLTLNKAKLCKILMITLVFEKNANFFAENSQKSQKIVIITSVPGFYQNGYFVEYVAIADVPYYVGSPPTPCDHYGGRQKGSFQYFTTLFHFTTCNLTLEQRPTERPTLQVIDNEFQTWRTEPEETT